MIEKIKKFIEGLSDDDFYNYMSPFSYYNSSLINSISIEKIVKLSNYNNLLKVYFELNEKEDLILEIIYDRIQSSELEYEEYDDEQITINWIPIVMHILEMPLSMYNEILLDYDRKLIKLIKLNESIDFENYYVLNTKGYFANETYYSEKLEYIVSKFGFPSLRYIDELYTKDEIRTENFNIKKGGFILNTNAIKLDKITNPNSDFLKRLIQLKRQKNIDLLFNERIITKFKRFN
jgi:hypothetical protein